MPIQHTQHISKSQPFKLAAKHGDGSFLTPLPILPPTRVIGSEVEPSHNKKGTLVFAPLIQTTVAELPASFSTLPAPVTTKLRFPRVAISVSEHWIV